MLITSSGQKVEDAIFNNATNKCSFIVVPTNPTAFVFLQCPTYKQLSPKDYMLMDNQQEKKTMISPVLGDQA